MLQTNCIPVAGKVANAKTRALVGDTGVNSPEQCSKKVKNLKPLADGMTWDTETHKCFAEFGATNINTNLSCCFACIFRGMLIYYFFLYLILLFFGYFVIIFLINEIIIGK